MKSNYFKQIRVLCVSAYLVLLVILCFQEGMMLKSTIINIPFHKKQLNICSKYVTMLLWNNRVTGWIDLHSSWDGGDADEKESEIL